MGFVDQSWVGPVDKSLLSMQSGHVLPYFFNDLAGLHDPSPLGEVVGRVHILKYS
jgi:hypothetical protein